MSLWRNLRDFFKGYSDYQPSVAALVAYLPVGDLETLRLWREKHIPYVKDTDPKGLDNYNGADLTIAAKGGDCESIAAVYKEVIQRWPGWQAWHVLFVFVETGGNGTYKAHDVCVFVDPDGEQGWIDGGVCMGGYSTMRASYEALGWHITDWWVVNDIGQLVLHIS